MSEEFILVGRRSLLCGEVIKAVENFQKACELIAAEHGDLDERLAEPNLLYGSALLELARMESPVLGNALDGVPEEDDVDENEMIEEGPEMTADEKEELSNQVLDAMCSATEDETDKVNSTSENVTEAEVEDEQSKDEKEEETATGDDAEDAESSSSDEGDDEKQDVGEEKADNAEDGSDNGDLEDISNLQLAWEVVEVAKQIYSRTDNKENRLKVADCLEKLAEISREKEDYSQAITDLQECMSIRTSLMSSDSREIAETHYQFGTTHAVAGDLDSASVAFRLAVNCLKELSKNMNSKLNENKETEDLESIRATIKDIDELIPDVERRCSEVEEDRLASQASIISAPAVGIQNESTDPADDISHLIRKKRPAKDNVESKESVETNGTSETKCSPNVKKAKVDTNGTADCHNGDKPNGHAITEVNGVSH